MTKQTKSPAYQLIEFVWSNTAHDPWERLNHCMADAVELAIGAGMRFANGDFASIFREFRGAYWFGSPRGERFYSLACLVDNVSACQSFEAFMRRRPIIVDNVHCDCDWGGYMHANTVRRKRGRIAAGFSFPWNGETVTVTSMPCGDDPAIACAYSPYDDSNLRRVLRRYKITADIVVAERAKRKKEAGAAGGGKVD